MKTEGVGVGVGWRKEGACTFLAKYFVFLSMVQRGG